MIGEVNMNPRTESSRPVIDITIDIDAVRGWVVSLSLGVVMLLGLIGAAVSPIVDGHPVILTRERLAIKSYLDAVEDWLTRFEDIAMRLNKLEPTVMSVPSAASAITPMHSLGISTTAVATASLPTHIDLPPQVPLPTLQPPVNQLSNLYDRAHQAEQATQDLQAIDHVMQSIEVPTSLNGLHTLAMTTLQDFAAWSSTVLDAIGAPSADNLAAIQPARQGALDSLSAVRNLIKLQPEVTP